MQETEQNEQDRVGESWMCSWEKGSHLNRVEEMEP
jgi:hypothetical protein